MNIKNTTEDDITEEVLRRFEGTQDPRLRQIMQSLVTHLHSFVKDVELSEAEWWKAIEFLTKTGHMCDDNRQEFILLSDTLGVSMVVDLINHRKPTGATESTVFGPFHREGAPDRAFGEDITALSKGGTPTVLEGRVLSLSGEPIKGAELDVWQADPEGLYDQQIADIDGVNMRGKFHTDAEGRYLVRTMRPVAYSIPDDGPVGQMLRATNRHSWRPAHVHFVVSAPGYEPVTTHLFDSVDQYLQSDTVFAVKESLICDFTMHDGVCKCHFDFVLKPAAA
jgi:protocatechuate 3,4-dioxygenase beta subunit